MQQLADEGRLSASTYFVVGGSCAPVPGVIQRDYFSHCANMPGLLADLVRRESVQSVVLGASWAGYRDKNMLIERKGKRLPLDMQDGKDAFYANLEDYVRMLQSEGATVYLVLGAPVHGRFIPGAMVTRSMTGIRVARDAGEPVSVSELRSVYNSVDTDLRIIAKRTGAGLLDPFPDVCGSGNTCSPFFGAGEPKFSDGMHLRPVFVRAQLHFLDFLFR